MPSRKPYTSPSPNKDMEEEDHLLHELKNADGVELATKGDTTGVLHIWTDYGSLPLTALSSQLLSTLGRYDGALYEAEDELYDFYFVFG